MGLLRERVVLVTGAGSGIGRGIARAVAEEGGRVVATDLAGEAAGETAERVEAAGGTALALPLDVTDDSAIEGALAATVERFGRLDGLANSAGVLRMGPAIDTPPGDFDAQFDVNVRALLACCRLGARAMEGTGGGAIVNVASNAGKVGYPNMAAYNASKAAVISLTRSLASEWALRGINVNAVCPGGVDTPMLTEVAEWVGGDAGADPAALRGEMTPAQLGRHVRPIEVGRVVAFLLSDRAAIIRGQAINVDGGDTPY